MEQTAVPDGFRRTYWEHINERAEVFIHGVSQGLPHAYGPFIVDSVEHRRLLSLAADRTFHHVGDDLLVRHGPPVIMAFHDGRFVGCYADVPLEIATISINMQEAAIDVSSQRPQATQFLSRAHADSLDAILPFGWPSMARDWYIAKKPPVLAPTGERVVFHAGNALLARRITTIMFQFGMSFSVTNTDGLTTFDVARKDYIKLRKHAPDMELTDAHDE